MLQQTRVSTVIPYFNKWVAKWPTIQALADAEHDDVLAAWKGLGYYSRATRLHQGAKDMVAQNEKNQKYCPIPSKAKDLLGFSGIGPYTAGAISSIAFGEAEAVLDGNVARVLSRQLGLYADAKDKKTSDFLWKVADRLVKHVAPESKASAIPGAWNQAVMELGSTICTPRPKCDECPIQKTCRAYAEGETLSGTDNVKLMDIEDACNLCDQLDSEDLVTVPEDDEAGDEDMKATKKRKREADKAKGTNSISQYFTKSTPTAKENGAADSNAKVETLAIGGTKKRKAPGGMQSKRVATYCSLFPKKITKKKVAEEECVVCLVELRNSNKESQWLIEQRPAKGESRSCIMFLFSRRSLAQFQEHDCPCSTTCFSGSIIRR
jgi:A/G-specific adenine glycosylase